MKRVDQVNIQRLPPQGLYGIFFSRISEIGETKQFTPWALVYQKLCRNFSITKMQLRELLFIFRDFGFIEISCKGIKLTENHNDRY